MIRQLIYWLWLSTNDAPFFLGVVMLTISLSGSGCNGGLFVTTPVCLSRTYCSSAQARRSQSGSFLRLALTETRSKRLRDGYFRFVISLPPFVFVGGVSGRGVHNESSLLERSVKMEPLPGSGFASSWLAHLPCRGFSAGTLWRLRWCLRPALAHHH